MKISCGEFFQQLNLVYDSGTEAVMPKSNQPCRPFHEIKPPATIFSPTNKYRDGLFHAIAISVWTYKGLSPI